MADLQMSQEELEQLSNQSSQQVKQIPINVAGIITYGFHKNIISMDLNNPINQQSYDAVIKKVPKWDDYQVPVGYLIHNTSEEEIKDILVPSYTLNPKTNMYEGKVVKKTLIPDDVMILPTEWLMILLMRLGYGLQVGNGEFRSICQLDTNDYGEKLRNVYFTPDQNYAELFDKLESNLMIGAYKVISDNELSNDLFIIEDKMLELFGYLMNVYNLNDQTFTPSTIFLRKIIKLS